MIVGRDEAVVREDVAGQATDVIEHALSAGRYLSLGAANLPSLTTFTLLSSTMPPVTTYNCRYCGKPLETRQGVKSHLAQRPECLKAFYQTVTDAKARQTIQTEGFVDAMDCDPAEDCRPYKTIEYTGLPEVSTASNLPASLAPHVPMASHRVTVEEVPDEDAGHLPHEPWVEDFPQPTGTTFGRGETYFDCIHREKQLAGQDAWMPFESEDEWELVKWLMTSGLTQKDIDHYLKLKIVSTYPTSDLI